MKKNSGYVMIVVIFVIVAIAVLGLVIISLMTEEDLSAMRNFHSVRAFQIADGGMRHTVASSLAADSDWSDNSDYGPVTLGAGYFTIHYVSKSKNASVVESTGTVSGINRTVRSDVKIIRQSLMPRQFTDYVVYGGKASYGDQVNFYNQSKIVGNFFYNGPVSIFPPRPPACQTEGTIISVSIDPAPAVGIPDYYASWEAYTTYEALPFDDSYYVNWLVVGAKSGTSNLTLSGTQNINLNGGTQWYKNITMTDDSYITGPGTICATRTFNILDRAYFVGNVRIIARGSPTSVDLRAQSPWTTSAEVIALDDISITGTVTTSAGSVFYSQASGDRGISINGNITFIGSALAPYGEVENKGNGWIKGLAYCQIYSAYNSATFEGGSVFLSMANFLNDTMLIQNAALLPSDLPYGISGGATQEGIDATWFESF